MPYAKRIRRMDSAEKSTANTRRPYPQRGAFRPSPYGGRSIRRRCVTCVWLRSAARLSRSPNHPISRFKKAVRVMNDRNEVVQHQRRLRPIAPERRSARNCARRSNATVLDRCRTGGLCGLAAADLPSERSDDVRRRLQHQSESGRGDPPGANGFARVLCPPPRTVPGGGIFAGNSNGRRLRRDCARSGGASLLLPQRTQKAQRNRWINLCLLRGSLCPLWFIFARWCITRLPKHRIFSSIS